MVHAQSQREVVLPCEVRLKHQRAIEILLVEVVGLVAILRIQLVQRSRRHQGDVRSVLTVEDESMLHIALISVGMELDSVEIQRIRR